MSDMSEQLDSKQLTANRFKLSVLIIIPFVLMATAWIMFYTGVGMPTGTSNKGMLINPPLQINPVAAETIAPGDDKLWRFILPLPALCDQQCADKLYLTRQIRVAMGKHMIKLRRVLLVNAETEMDASMQALLNAEHSDARVVSISADKLKAILNSNETAAKTDPFEYYYIADPRGFVMLAYGKEHSYKDAMKDLKFLLKNAPSP